MTNSGFRLHLWMGTVVDDEEAAAKNNCPQVLVGNRDIPAVNQYICGNWDASHRILSCAACHWRLA
jgi:hypothetical protein